MGSDDYISGHQHRDYEQLALIKLQKDVTCVRDEQASMKKIPFGSYTCNRTYKISTVVHILYLPDLSETVTGWL